MASRAIMASPAALSHAPHVLQRERVLRGACTVVFKNVEVAADSSNAVVETESMVKNNTTAFWLHL